jgi:phosphoserine phosphatase RsbU/P
VSSDVTARDEVDPDAGGDPWAVNRRLTFLVRASELLSASLDHRETVVAIADLAVPHLADACTVYLVHRDEVLLVAAAHVDHGRQRVLAGIAARREPTDDDVAKQVAAGGRLVLDEARRQLWLPLRRHGRTLGVVSLWMEASHRPLGEAELALIEDLGRRSAVALDHALRYRARLQEAKVLQRSLLPPAMPVVPGVQLSARYRPAGDGLQVGGDFFDVFGLGPGAGWGIVIGDVAGRGVAAASLTALTRYTARAVAAGGTAPDQVLEAVNRAVLAAEVGERFCTMASARMQVEEGRVDLAVALGGHPRPLLLSAGGEVRPVGAEGSALGLFEAADVTTTNVSLGPGDAVVLFTDGLIEARAPDRAWSDGLLEAVLAGATGQDAADLAASIEAAILRFEDDDPRDDIGLLVVRVPTAAETVTSDVLVERLPTEPIAAYVGRGLVRSWLAGQHLPEEVADDIVLVASELVTNAAREASDRVELRLWRTTAAVVVEVSDDGEGFVPPPDAHVAPSPQAEAGRGLWLVQMLSDHSQFNPGPWGTVVRCRFVVAI